VKQIRTSLLALAVLAATGTLQGCGKEEHKKAASQVIAKVNGDEISVHQVNFVLSKAQGITTENAEQAKREILDKLIDQQLAIQQAEAAKLDRNPAVMQNIEAARRDILARAYLEQIAAAQPKVTPDEAKKYYSEHPELFSQRRVYSLQEILVPASSAADVRQLVAQNKPMQDIAGTLKERNVKFAANAGVRPADQLPMAVASQLQSVKDGQTVVIDSPQGTMVVHIANSQSQPVTEVDALPRIQQFLGNQRNSEAVAKELKNLRAKAAIEQTSEIAAAPPPSTVAPAAPAPAPDATTPTPASTPAAKDTDAIDAKSVAKGVAGLK
jgi:EpsD family peptidyl-prolyl cis-trans isomerase